MSESVKYPKIVTEVNAQLKQSDETNVAAYYAHLAQFTKDESETVEFNAKGEEMLHVRALAKAKRDIKDAKATLASVLRSVKPEEITSNAMITETAKKFWKSVRAAENNVLNLENAEKALVAANTADKEVSAEAKARWDSYTEMFTEE